jgi:hypothetical protein
MFLVNAQIMGLSEKGEIYPYVMGLQYIYIYVYVYDNGGIMGEQWDYNGIVWDI